MEVYLIDYEIESIIMITRLANSIEGLIGVLGYRILISRFSAFKRVPKDMDKEFWHMYKECQWHTMTSVERSYALYKAVEYIVNSKIPGDFVECGVWKGGSSMMVARTLLKMGKTERKLYLYDTFAGMTKPTEKDVRISDSSSAIHVWEKMQEKDYNKWAFASIQEVRTNMLSTQYPEKNITFVKGRVEDTIPDTMPSQIALLRLDTDWYDSTYHELKHLFPLLSDRGVLIVDDYGHFAGAREAVDTYLEKHDITILLNRIDYTGRLGIK